MGDACNIFKTIALENFLGAEIDLSGSLKVIGNGRFDREHTTSYKRSIVTWSYIVPFPEYSETVSKNSEYV